MSRVEQEPPRPSPWLRPVDRFVPPEILAAGGDRRTRARILAATCLGGGLLTAVGGTLSTLALDLATGIAWTNIVGGGLIFGGAFVLRRTGWLLGIANVLVTVGWAMCVALYLGSGSVNISALYAFSMLPLIAILIGGSVTGIVWGFVCAASAVLLLWSPLEVSFPVDFSVADMRTQIGRDVVLITAWLTIVGVLYDRLRGNAQRAAELARARAEESEARFAQAFEANPDGIVIIDWETGQVVECNDGFLALTGLRRDATRGDLDRAAALTMPPEQQRAIRAALAEKGRCDEIEVTFADSRAGARSLRLHARQVELGGRACVLTTVRDVTEQQRLEEQLRQAQKMEAVGQLAGAIAHDFNNMLTVISGYAEHLSEELDAERSEMASEIHRAAERSADLTRQLLAFSRRQVLQPQVLDLNQLVRRLESLMKRLIGESVAIELQLAADLGPVRADPGQVEQVIVNLAINARDAMPEGGTLRLETENVQGARGSSGETRPWVCLRVRDDGEGMDEATLQRAFEPFFTTKEQGKGTGLGLSTVHGIVSQSDGEITISSHPDRGTVVEVYLPRLSEDRAATSDGVARAERDPAAGSGRTILLVEDDAMVRRLASRSLWAAGYEVVEAGDGQEAIEIFERRGGAVDLVLTDVVMPRRGGADLARVLRESDPSLPVLFMSGYPNPREHEEAPLPPGEAFVQKPFSPAVLRQRVGELLGRPTDEPG